MLGYSFAFSKKNGLEDLSLPWNSLIFIQNPSNSVKRTFLYAKFLRIPYGWTIRMKSAT